MIKALKFSLALIFGFPILVFSQKTNEKEDYVNDNVLKYDDYTYKPNIKTVQCHQSTWEYAAPIIDLNSQDQIELSFDDLDSDKKQYSLTFIHCNADWTPSDLMISEYLTGFFDINIINFDYSVNTLQKYTHYSVMFPQQNIKFTKSGNYLMYVYLNGDKKDLVLSRRFLVYDNKITVATTFRQPIGGEDQYNKQHIDFSIYNSGYDITNPYADLKVVISQNNRWDNAVTDIKPTFMGNNTLTYSLDDASTFNGGNEFRYFDTRSLRILTERVKENYKDESLKNHTVLYPEELRATKAYTFYNDINGNFLIKNTNSIGNTDLESDYVYVEFFLPYVNPEPTGNFYILGKLTDWRMNKLSKMTYNPKRFGYEAKLYLKQGYYNYEYVLSNDKNRSGDETITEGSYWDTENDYNIFVYHRKIGTYYDQLIGFKKLNSLKK
ncbi:MAG: DUF5103 domain-containing protein [Bacteroidota bacterium]|nr:DUF5103 domain-containing protein [Bacteroidota bacterium]